MPQGLLRNRKSGSHQELRFIRAQVNPWRIPKTRISDYSRLLRIALEELPNQIFHASKGRNGEGIFHDEAEIQKRIISYRLAKYLQPYQIIESHPGLGIGSLIYRNAAPRSIQLPGRVSNF
jgi:hypothetical protein